MTEKKFTLEWESEETCQIAYNGDYIGCEEAVDFLNDLTEENKEFKKTINKLKSDLKIARMNANIDRMAKR